MKRKDSRIVNIYIPATETSPEISFDISISDLKNILKSAIENNYEMVSFKIGDQTANISTKKLKRILNLAISQLSSQNLVPDVLKSYLNCFYAYTTSSYQEKLSARNEEIEKIWTCLCSKQKSNVILVGEHGVGKTTIAKEIARQICIRRCPKQFVKYSVLEINTFELLELAEKSQFLYNYIIEELDRFAQANKEKVIFYIDNLLHIKCDIDLLKLFTSFVKKYNVKMMASLDLDDFEDYFENDISLMKYLNPILIEEPEVEEIYPMIKSQIDLLQETYGVRISEKMIRFSILTGLYLSSSNSANPESTIDIINFALADAQRKKQEKVSKQNILSYYYIDFKLAKKTNKEEKCITAYHEAGHYLVSKLSPNIKSFKNAFVTILPIGGALGLTANYDDFGQQLTFSKDDFIDDIAFSLGGRVGEAIYTNEFSSGAQQDLISANSMAENLVLSYGLSGIEGEQNKTYMIGNYIKDFLLTDELRLKINQEISSIINEAYKRAEDIINENRELLEEIVQRLLEDGVLMGDELEEICEKHKKSEIS